MKFHSPAGFVAALSAASTLLLVAATTASAAQKLAGQKNCLACHQIATKIVGPAYKDVAAKYAGKPEVVPVLVKKVMNGGSGVWGAVPMPANPQVTEAEAKQLVQWVLSLK